MTSGISAASLVAVVLNLLFNELSLRRGARASVVAAAPAPAVVDAEGV